MKVLITGGHFSPARAVMHAFPKSVQIVYVGRKHALEKDSALSLEYTLLQKEGVPFREIQPGRFHRLLYRNTPLSLYKIIRGFFQAWAIVNEEKPDVILSFGGYVALPICVIGFLKNIPIVLHDQTFETGLTNQLLSYVATKVCLSWKSSVKYFQKGKTIVTGNPNLAEIFSYRAQEGKKHPLTILVTGGNSGSHRINVYIEHSLKELLSIATVIHQTGDAQEFKDYDRLTKLVSSFPPELQKKYHIQKFFTPEELHMHEATADLVISRAGANTVGELAILEKPSLMVPIPHTQRDEQKKNAQFLKNAGLAVVIDQETVTDEQFLATVHDMIKHNEDYTLKDSFKAEIDTHQEAAAHVAKITQQAASREKTKEVS